MTMNGNTPPRCATPKRWKNSQKVINGSNRQPWNWRLFDKALPMIEDIRNIKSDYRSFSKASPGWLGWAEVCPRTLPSRSEAVVSKPTTGLVVLRCSICPQHPPGCSCHRSWAATTPRNAAKKRRKCEKEDRWESKHEQYHLFLF